MVAVLCYVVFVGCFFSVSTCLGQSGCVRLVLFEEREYSQLQQYSTVQRQQGWGGAGGGGGLIA